MSIIELKHVHQSFGASKILNDISLTISRGSFTSILGPTGSGKTSVFRLIAGLDEIESGKVYINQQLATRDSQILLKPHKRGIGLVFQDIALWPHLSIFKNLEFPLKSLKYPKTKIVKRIHEMIDLMNLTGLDKRYPHQLSGGQQQLAGIARALVADPDIILMDEPLAGLDYHLKKDLRETIKILHETSQKTFVYITHDQEEAFELSDEIIILDEGKLVETGKPEKLLTDPVQDFTKYYLRVQGH
ncbi:MAG: hypothetical protein IEMM0008_0926 [bacterium]|nr:MAG: hypothetical protein IEMM0008_0926 [bacterium]